MSRRVLNLTLPIVDSEGKQERQFQEWQTLVTKLLPFKGEGSPEGVVPAQVDQQYYDTTAAAGSILYIKMLPDIGGDTSQGWELA